MVIKINYFIMEKDKHKFTDVLSQLAARGIDGTVISDEDDQLFFKLEGTALHGETNDDSDKHSLVPDMHQYILKYRETVICQTRIRDSGFDRSIYSNGFIRSTFGTLQDVPADLRHDIAITDLGKYQDTMFPVGKNKPSSLEMQHLAFLEITEKHLVMSNGIYYFKLSTGKGFSTYKTPTFEYKDRYILKYNGKDLLNSYEDHRDNHISISIDPYAIGAAIDYKNLLCLPKYVRSNCHPTSNTCNNKLLYVSQLNSVAEGTISGCLNGIINNEYDGFELYISPRMSNFSYEVLRPDETTDQKAQNNEDMSQFLVALRANISLKLINLEVLRFTENDLLRLLDVVSKKQQMPILRFWDCRFLMSNAEFVKILTQVSRFKLIVYLDNKKEDHTKVVDILGNYINARQTIPKTAITVTVPPSKHFYGIYIFDSTKRIAISPINQTTSQLFNLPRELREYIYNYLPLNNLGLFASTCKRADLDVEKSLSLRKSSRK